MIDFRYHLVSLVSVFIALAVGVVLGAGPLRGQIANQLNASVEQLRDEKNQLRSDLTVAVQALEYRDAFTEEVLPTLVASRLAGRTVALVILPEADQAGVEPLVRAVRQAGGTVTAQVELEASWTDPESEAERESASRRLSTVLQGSGLSPDPDVALTRALVRPGVPTAVEGQAANSENDPLSERILDVLDGEGLLSVLQAPEAGAEQVVVLAPPVQLEAGTVELETTNAGEVTTPSPTASGGASPPATPAPSTDPSSQPSVPAPATLTGWAALANQLDGAGRGCVVAGPASAATSSGLLTRIREDEDVSARVSTVDTFGAPMGDISTVMALQEQLLGQAGAYGFGDGASAILPEVATAGETR